MNFEEMYFIFSFVNTYFDNVLFMFYTCLTHLIHVKHQNIFNKIMSHEYNFSMYKTIETY